MLLLYFIMVRIVNVPIERQIIKDTKSNRYWLEYFRKSYEQFTGVSTATIGKQLYTREESIERYSINLAYWYIQLEMEKTESTPQGLISRAKLDESNVKYSEGIEPKSVFIKSQIVRLINIIKDYHPSLTSRTIHQRAMDIKNNYLNNQA